MDFLARYEAAEATQKAFFEQPFVWGKADCLHMAAFCLKNLGHERPLKGVLKYTSEKGAIRAMLKAGYRGLADAVDDFGLERIAPAMAIHGDLIAWPQERSGLGEYALAVALGDDRMIGFLPGPDGNLVGTIGPVSAAATASDEYGVPMLAWRSV